MSCNLKQAFSDGITMSKFDAQMDASLNKKERYLNVPETNPVENALWGTTSSSQAQVQASKNERIQIRSGIDNQLSQRSMPKLSLWNTFVASRSSH